MAFEDQQLSRWLAMAGVAKCKKQLRGAVEQRVKSGLCLIVGCECAGTHRGLCWGHYLKFNRSKNQLPKCDRVEFEKKQIEEGRVLAVGQAREIKSPNPFSME